MHRLILRQQVVRGPEVLSLMASIITGILYLKREYKFTEVLLNIPFLEV